MGDPAGAETSSIVRAYKKNLMAAYKAKYPRKPANQKKSWLGLRFGKEHLPGNKVSGSVAAPKAKGFTVRNVKNIRRWSRLSLLLVLLCLVVGSGGWFSYQFLTDSNIFRLTEVSVLGNRRIQDEQIVELTGLVMGTNLLGFDVQSAVDRAQSLSWVERVEIKINWPDGVVVRVQEFQPLALANLKENEGQQLYYINKRGVVFALVEPGQDIDFPVITGDLAGIELESKLVAADTPAAVAALSFLRLAARGNAILPVQAISEVHIDPLQGLVVYLVDRPFPIYIGHDRVQTKYYRLVKILERLYRKKKIDEIKEIRMDYTENKVLVAMNTSL
jgi:cell division septal protein FtsQ